jgi:hypothetical protein
MGKAQRIADLEEWVREQMAESQIHYNHDRAESYASVIRKMKDLELIDEEDEQDGDEIDDDGRDIPANPIRLID